MARSPGNNPRYLQHRAIDPIREKRNALPAFPHERTTGMRWRFPFLWSRFHGKPRKMLMQAIAQRLFFRLDRTTGESL